MGILTRTLLACLFTSSALAAEMADLVNAVGKQARLVATCSNKFYDKCGGTGFEGSTCCPSGSVCKADNDWYSACTPLSRDVFDRESAGPWSQCGGEGYTGNTECADDWTCAVVSKWYSQCRLSSDTTSASSTQEASSTSPTSIGSPASSSSSESPLEVSSPPMLIASSGASEASATSSPTVSSQASTAPATSTSSSGSASASASATASATFLGGINLSGLEWSVDTWGQTSGESAAALVDQIAHFTAQGVNVFRIPFVWQRMEGGGAGTGITDAYFNKVKTLVNAADKAGAYVILDLHNYARWENGTVGQGGPTNQQFNNLWSQLALKFSGMDHVIYGLMNEPHDLDVNIWAASLQLAVNTIRGNGARNNYILLPGTTFTSMGDFISTNEPALSKIVDPAGVTDKLIYDLHQYLDADTSGTSPECTDSHVTDLFEPVAKKLREKGRRAFVSEIGGGNTASCEKYLAEALAYVKANSDAYLGFTAWAAGSFKDDYELVLTPKADGTDQALWAKAIQPNLPGSAAAASKSKLRRDGSKQRL